MTNTAINQWQLDVKKYEKCPYCKNGELNTRVRRSFFVKHLFKWVGEKRYMCDVCARKKYVKRHVH